MEKKEVFRILGIGETTEEDKITEAYREKLKVTHPEDNPQEFQLLRQAYEEAVYYARHPEDEEEQGEMTEVDEWLSKVEEVYTDIEKRGKKEEWERIFSDPVCEGLDTFVEARDKILLFLSNHIFVPQSVWILVDKILAIRENYEELLETVPEDYLQYVVEHIENDTFLDYGLFRYTTKQKEDARPDDFIRAYFSCKNQLDDMEPEEARDAISQLEEYGVYHPFIEVEKIRYYLKTENAEKAAKIAKELEQLDMQHHYHDFYIAETYEALGEKEKALEIREKIIKEYPNHYGVKEKIADYYMEQCRYYEARELFQEIIENTGENDWIREKRKNACQGMLEELREKLEKGEDDPRFPGNHLKMQMVYCLWQTGKAEEALEVLSGFEPEEDTSFEYQKLKGTLLDELGQVEHDSGYYQKAHALVERALDCYQKAHALLSEEKEEDRRKMGPILYRMGLCCLKLDKADRACEILSYAGKILDKSDDRNCCLELLAGIYESQEEYEKVVDICDEILRDDREYFPAYVYRQKAFYMLNRPQEVIDDYYSAIRIYPGNELPYQYALEIFMSYGQLEDAKDVLDRIKEYHISSPRITILEARYYRMQSDEEDLEKASNILKNFLDEIKIWKEEEDERAKSISDKDMAEISYEFAMLEGQKEEYEMAIKHIQKALSLCPENSAYHMMCGIFYKNAEEYEKAIKEFEGAAKDYDETPSYYYNLGLCYEGLEQKDQAAGYFKKSLEYQPCYGEACDKLSDYYRDLYEDTNKEEYLELAISYLTQELEREESAYYLIGRGLLYLDNLYLPEAKKDFLRAEELVPGDWFIENALGRCEQYLENYEEAISYYQKSIACMKAENRSYTNPYNNLIKCYKILHDFESREKVCLEAIKVFPEDLSFWEDLGYTYNLMGEYEKALEAFSHMEKDESYYSAVGDVALCMGDKEKWRQCDEKSVEVGSDKRQEYYDYGTDCMFGAKDYKSAIPILEKSLALTEELDDKAICLIDIATCYYMLGEDKKAYDCAKEAQKCYEAYFEQKGCTEEEYMSYRRSRAARIANKGWMLLCLGQKEEAIGIFEEMYQIQKCRQCGYKACFESRLYLARAFEREGDLEKAVALYEETLKINRGSGEAKISIEILKNR